MEARDCPSCGAYYRPRTPAEAERCWGCAGLGVEYLLTTRPGAGRGGSRVEAIPAAPRAKSVHKPRASRGELLDALQAL